MNKRLVIAGAVLIIMIPVFAFAAQFTSNAQINGNAATVTLQSDTELSDAVVDFELYDTSNNKIGQAFLTTTVPNGTLACTWNMSAPSGSYTLKVGIFNSNWSTLVHWNDNAATVVGPLGGDNSITCGNAATPPSATTYTTSASTPGGTSGNTATFTTTVQANQSVANVLIDTEAYDSFNNKVMQWWEVRNLSADAPLTLTHDATLPNAGAYQFKVGLFSSDWSSLYSWNDNAGEFAVTNGGDTTPPPPPSTTSGTVSPTTQTVEAGAEIDFSGHNFGHEEDVQISRNGTTIRTTHADGGGNFSTGSMGMPTTNGTYVFTFTGLTSGIRATSTIYVGSPTPSQGTLEVSADTSSHPNITVTSGGSNNITIGSIKLHAGDAEAVTVQRIGLKLTSGNPSDVSTVYLYYGPTLVGTATFGTSANATSTLSTPLSLAAGSDTTLTLKADFTDIGPGKPGTEGDVVTIDPDSIEGTGQSSGLLLANGATPGIVGTRVYNSYPTFTYDTTSATLTSGVNTLITLQVGADSAGNVGLYKLSFKLATTSVMVTSLNFTGPNGNVGTVSAPDANNVVTVTFNNTSNTSDAIVGAGTSKTYVLQGLVTGLGASGSVATSLMADSSASPVTFIASSTNPNIVWSPVLDGTRDTTGNDWTNGYGLSGCFASAGPGNNCAARVTSK